MALRSKAARIESPANGDWRLIQGDQSPIQFSAEDILVLLEDNTVLFGLTVRGATQRWQRDCNNTSVLALLAREVEGCGRVWGG
jgi:hypothetical protein